MLSLLWSINVGWLAHYLAWSNSTLGVASFARCFFIIDWNGTLLMKRCAPEMFLKASFSYNTYVFVGEHHVYVVKGYKVVEVVNGTYAYALMTPEGLALCADRLTLPERKFDVKCSWLGLRNDTLIATSPSKTYLIDLKSFKIVKVFDAGGEVGAVCGPFVALGGKGLAAVLNTANGKVSIVRNITYVGEIAFSENCKYLALTDVYRGELKIFKVPMMKLVYVKKFYFFPQGKCPLSVFGVAWHRNLIAVGRGDGWVDVYRVRWSK